MDLVVEKRFPVDAKDYRLYEEVGEGVSATVYRALCIPLNEIVAIKVLDLEKCNNDLDGIRREVQTMRVTNHPNVLRAHCSFTTGHCLWVVMPYMAGGSCLHIMKSAYPEGFEEPVIATLLRKAGNILIDSNGAIKLADFGVSACMFDAGDRQRSRNTFVGTPCWMAPEVMQQLHGYDFKADIWSFGITALELAHGHAPFSKYPPMKVLLMTLQNAPPGLDYERDKRFSKSFKELVTACLVKDPKKRPTAEKLMKHHFFKHARSNDFLARSIVDNLAPLGERFRMLKAKEADLLVQNKALYEDKEQLSQEQKEMSYQVEHLKSSLWPGFFCLPAEHSIVWLKTYFLQEYIRGISAWNFNLEDLKSQAALIQDYDCMSNAEDPNSSGKQNHADVEVPAERLSTESGNHSNATTSQDDGFNNLHDLESSLASFPIKPLQALKGCFDVGEDDEGATSPSWKGTAHLETDQFLSKGSLGAIDQESGRNEGENSGRSSSLPRHVILEHKKFLSGSLIPDNAFSSKKAVGEADRDSLQPKNQSERNYSGPLLYRQRRDTNNLPSAEDTSEGAVVQRKGRFKVTSAELSPKEEIIRLIKYAEETSGKHAESADAGTNDLLQVTPASTKEKELQSQMITLQQRIASIAEELQRQKIKNAQLEKQLHAVVGEDGKMRKENEA
ncbi:protein kinase domain-containing protein [Citrus sinensis]|uniref:Protein kinase domain-containing protein n=1 Tax=Citrus sinensis TaxID=2711 RepID=A0ACB8MZ91_CITSI|nr:protein kinase domain-containing protein [Citrus sinensis]